MNRLGVRTASGNSSLSRRSERSGAVLLMVLVIVVALSVVIYAFSQHMLVDLAVVRAQHRDTQQEHLSESIIDQLASCAPRDLQAYCHPFEDEPERGGLPVVLSAGIQTGVASIEFANNGADVGFMAVLSKDPRSSRRSFGLSNESAKLNLNSLASGRLSRKQVISKLRKYKDLSETTAEGIANALGVVDLPPNLSLDARSQAASTKALATKQMHSLADLLSIPGVTEELLMGEDRNLNGLLDENENDGEASWPPDNRDGCLDAGWSEHWTLIGAESNYRSAEKRKINLNQQNLVALYDAISGFATAEEARFVVAWRMSSPVYTDSFRYDEAKSREEAANELATSFEDRVAKQLGLPEAGNGQEKSPDDSSTNPGANKTRAGLDLSGNSARKLRSLLDLASCQLQLIIDGKDTVLASPFANDPVSLERWLPLWESQTCLTDEAENNSRINIMQASTATLTTVDGISDELARAIVSERSRLLRERLGDPKQTYPANIGWLIAAGLVTSAELRDIADEITLGGSVFQGYAVGQLNTSRTANVKFFELDGRSSQMKIRRVIALPPLTNAQRLPITE